jgi:hypothetical protein
MKRLIYSSNSSENVDFKIVGEILTHAMNRNKEIGITGMMVYDGHRFLQCIEGDETVVDELWQKLTKDTRHHSLYIHGTEFDDKRLFPEWNMGYMNNRPVIQKMIHSITANDVFSLETLSYAHAKLILLQLSFIL